MLRQAACAILLVAACELSAGDAVAGAPGGAPLGAAARGGHARAPAAAEWRRLGESCGHWSWEWGLWRRLSAPKTPHAPDDTHRALQDALGRDADTAVSNAIAWYGWRCGVAFLACGVLGLAAGGMSWYVFRQKLCGCCKLPFAIGSAAFVASIGVTVLLAYMLTGMVAESAEMIDAKVAGHALEQLAKEFLLRIKGLAQVVAESSTNTSPLRQWPLEIINPTHAKLRISYFHAVMMGSFDLALSEALDIEPLAPGCLRLFLLPDVFNLPLRALTFKPSEIIEVPVEIDFEGIWRRDEFGVHLEAVVPFHSSELPANMADMPALSVDMLMRSMTRGLQDTNSRGATMINVETLEVSGTISTHIRATAVFLAASILALTTTLGWLSCGVYHIRCRGRGSPDRGRPVHGQACGGHKQAQQPHPDGAAPVGRRIPPLPSARWSAPQDPMKNRLTAQPPLFPARYLVSPPVVPAPLAPQAPSCLSPGASSQWTYQSGSTLTPGGAPGQWNRQSGSNLTRISMLSQPTTNTLYSHHTVIGTTTSSASSTRATLGTAGDWAPQRPRVYAPGAYAVSETE